jgi:hypothetical protein
MCDCLHGAAILNTAKFRQAVVKEIFTHIPLIGGSILQDDAESEWPKIHAAFPLDRGSHEPAPFN